MISIDVNKLPEFMLKNGIAGVLIIWLGITNWRLSAVEEKLYDCYSKLSHITVDKDYSPPERMYAILPEPIKIKRS